MLNYTIHELMQAPSLSFDREGRQKAQQMDVQSVCQRQADSLHDVRNQALIHSLLGHPLNPSQAIFNILYYITSYMSSCKLPVLVLTEIDGERQDRQTREVCVRDRQTACMMFPKYQQRAC